MLVSSGITELAKLQGFGLAGVKFRSIALGSSATAVAAGNTALGAELTTGGAGRNADASVTNTLITTAFANDTVQLVSSWAFSATNTINEFGVFNADAANTGTMLLRQVFAAPLNVVTADSLTLTISVQAFDQTPTGATRITNAGIVEANRLAFTDLTATNAGIRSVALGVDNGTTLALAATNTTLGSEITVANNFGLARTQETSGPTVSLFTTTTTSDTTQVTSTWTVGAGAGSFVAVKEAGVFDTTGVSTGILWIRYVFAADLNLVPTDVFTMTFRLVNVP